MLPTNTMQARRRKNRTDIRPPKQPTETAFQSATMPFQNAVRTRARIRVNSQIENAATSPPPHTPAANHNFNANRQSRQASTKRENISETPPPINIPAQTTPGMNTPSRCASRGQAPEDLAMPKRSHQYEEDLNPRSTDPRAAPLRNAQKQNAPTPLRALTVHYEKAIAHKHAQRKSPSIQGRRQRPTATRNRQSRDYGVEHCHRRAQKILRPPMARQRTRRKPVGHRNPPRAQSWVDVAMARQRQCQRVDNAFCQPMTRVQLSTRHQRSPRSTSLQTAHATHTTDARPPTKPEPSPLADATNNRQPSPSKTSQGCGDPHAISAQQKNREMTPRQQSHRRQSSAADDRANTRSKNDQRLAHASHRTHRGRSRLRKKTLSPMAYLDYQNP